MGWMALKEGRVQEIREANLTEANALLEDGWDLYAALPMEGPSAQSHGHGHRYVKYVMVRRPLELNVEGL